MITTDGANKKKRFAKNLFHVSCTVKVNRDYKYQGEGLLQILGGKEVKNNKG